jgi:Zn-dependent M16 (insulinase) family peptidase
MVVVRGRPSPSLSSQLETEERNRVAERVARLGKEGLEQQKLIVEAAQNNKDPIPNAILAAIPVPDPNTISWINVQSVSTKAGSETLEVVENGSSILAVHIRTDRCSLPFSLHFDHVSVSILTSFICPISL